MSNVLTGTIARLDLAYAPGNAVLQRSVIVSSGFSHRLDPVAVVLGPSGLAYDAQHDVLYVASSSDNAIYADLGARTTTMFRSSENVVF